MKRKGAIGTSMGSQAPLTCDPHYFDQGVCILCGESSTSKTKQGRAPRGAGPF